MLKLLTKITLITSLLLLLGGCSVFERQEYEKRISRVSEVYPTEKVPDLFDKFPGGFNLYHKREETIDNQTFFHEVDLNGDPVTRKISGTYIKRNAGREIMIEVPISYDESRGLATESDYQFDPIMQNLTFMFQKVNLNEQVLEEMQYMDLSSNPVMESFDLRYKIINSQINDYLSLAADTALEINFKSGELANQELYHIYIYIYESEGATRYVTESVTEHNNKGDD